MNLIRTDLQKYLSYFFIVIIIGLISLTTIKTQHIAVDFAWIYSGSDFLYETSFGNGSLLSSSILFIGDIKPESISIIFSIIMSITSVLGLFIYARYFNLKLSEIGIFLCFIFFLDRLWVFKSGLNYPLSILEVLSNTSGQIGFAVSILTVAAFLFNNKFGSALLVLNLLIHPTQGLLVASYVSLQYILKRNYFNLILPISISLIFILINLQYGSMDKSIAVVDYIYNIDVHRRAIELGNLKFLLIPAIFTLFISDKKDLLIDWIFVITCLVVSYLYYNIKIEFLQFEFLALMPSRGVNIGVAIIIIKFYIDIIKKPEPKKIMVPLFLSVLLTPLSFHESQFLIYMIGQILLSIYYLFDINIQLKDKLSSSWKVTLNFFLVVLIALLSLSNLKLMQFIYPTQDYDDFFNSKESYILDLTGDYNIMVRNRNIIELLPMGLMDGYCYNPAGLVKANNIFYKLFNVNLWDLNITHKGGRINYMDLKHIIENFDQEDWQRAKVLKLKYLITPVDSDLDLKIAWSDNEKTIFQID